MGGKSMGSIKGEAEREYNEGSAASQSSTPRLDQPASQPASQSANPHSSPVASDDYLSQASHSIPHNTVFLISVPIINPESHSISHPRKQNR
ncbi:hypothetical protein E2C01_040737 [Portunus trituberculatus]|uniref:Uncharacterized protein n=1 Tax=Portunus trituberculatus TaxID=210409 RepID=A0A5B7FPK2_PORTR|nr:hypothetical protein [Portunus trituberculatus]